jgi:hypothetical protein
MTDLKMQKFYLLCDMVVNKLRQTEENILTIHDADFRIAFFGEKHGAPHIYWILEVKAWKHYDNIKYISRPPYDESKPEESYIVSEEEWMKAFENWTLATRKNIPAEVRSDA